MQIKVIITTLLFLFCANVSAQERAEVELETTEGNIRIALFNETPQHRDNFMKLVRMQFYDSLLVHRVIKDFMIQTGDLNSRTAQPGQLLGAGELDYTIEAEFRLPQIYHRRGMVAAARESDKVNPERRSGAAQFYIVWGKIYDDKRLAFVQQKLDSATNGAHRVWRGHRRTGRRRPHPADGYRQERPSHEGCPHTARQHHQRPLRTQAEARPQEEDCENSP